MCTVQTECIIFYFEKIVIYFSIMHFNDHTVNQENKDTDDKTNFSHNKRKIKGKDE